MLRTLLRQPRERCGSLLQQAVLYHGGTPGSWPEADTSTSTNSGTSSTGASASSSSAFGATPSSSTGTDAGIGAGGTASSSYNAGGPGYSAFPGSQSVDFGFKDVPWQEKQSLVGQVFSSVASSYDIMNDLMSGGMHRLWKDRLVATLKPFPGMQHLDVAGGTGDVAFRILRAIGQAERESRAKYNNLAYPNPAPGQQAGAGGGASPAPTPGSVVVCDINPQMLEAGRNKAQQAADLAGDQGLSFVEGNAENLSSFPDGAFDSYTIAFGIRNVTDRDAALREAHRVLKSGGRFLCLEFSPVNQPGLKELYDLYSFNVIPAIGGLVANDAASYQYLVESIRKFPDQETFADMIRAAGFKAVTYEELMGGIVSIHSGFKL